MGFQRRLELAELDWYGECRREKVRRLVTKSSKYSTRDEPALVKSQRTPPSFLFSVVHPAIDWRKTSSTCLSANRLSV